MKEPNVSSKRVEIVSLTLVQVFSRKYMNKKLILFQGKTKRRAMLARKVENNARIALPLYTLVFASLYFAVCIIAMGKTYKN